MNIEEMKALAGRLLVNYDKHSLPENFKELMNEWKRILENYDAELINKNLDEHLISSSYFPKLNQLVKTNSQKSSNILNPEQTRLMIAEKEKEITKQQVDPEFIRKQTQMAKDKIAEVRLNELKRNYNESIE